jgi:MPBQ/MSBQ methyltransferase
MMNPEMELAAKRHLQAQYTGIFPPSQLSSHFEEYVGLKAASELFDYMRECAPSGPGTRLLDIGCGFGSFVLLSRNNGLDAQGIDLADFDLAFARERLQSERPGEDGGTVYRKMDAQRMDFPDGTFDIVTLWNALEHIPDTGRLIAEAARVLKPGGLCFIVAPNYLAFRQEAHYLVPWLPLFPRGAASLYLRALGRDPAFLNESIFYVTDWGVKRLLARSGFRVDPEGNPEVRKLARIGGIRPGFKRSLLAGAQRAGLLNVVRVLLGWRERNPFKPSIRVMAVKVAAERTARR